MAAKSPMCRSNHEKLFGTRPFGMIVVQGNLLSVSRVSDQVRCTTNADLSVSGSTKRMPSDPRSAAKTSRLSTTSKSRCACPTSFLSCSESCFARSLFRSTQLDQSISSFSDIHQVYATDVKMINVQKVRIAVINKGYQSPRSFHRTICRNIPCSICTSARVSGMRDHRLRRLAFMLGPLWSG